MSERPVPAIVERRVEHLEAPSITWREMAARGPFDMHRHDELAAEAPCLQAVETSSRPPAAGALPPARLTVAAWNLERCKHVEESAALIGKAGADICLLSEMDLGMARSGNRHTAAELARLLGMGYAYGVEFIELGLGDAHEQAAHAREANVAGLHGNAILTRFAIDRAALLPLGAGGLWYQVAEQRRVGRRMALAVRHLLPAPVWFVEAHYESRLGPADRARETEILIGQLDRLCGSEPVVLAGDFNCRNLVDQGLPEADWLVRPESAEPMFARLAAAGFAWRGGNTSGSTRRRHRWSRTSDPLARIDWFFARGIALSAPQVVPAVGPDGELSDHEMILAEAAMDGARNAG